MKECQELVWELLNEVDSIVVPWRQIHMIETDDADNDLVVAKINKLKHDNSVE